MCNRLSNREFGLETSVRLTGVIPAIVTPFLPNGSLDDEGLRRYVRHVLEIPGVSGILCAGYTGEGSSLTLEEKVQVVGICADALGGRGPLIVGVDAPSTQRAIADGIALRDAGANVLQVNSPFYSLLRRGFLASPEVPVAFFREMAERVETPMTVFQYPTWSGLTYSPETIDQLAGIEEVVGIKEAVDMDTYLDDFNVVRGRVSMIADNNTYTLLSMLHRGADATMVGISNVGTELYVELFQAVQGGDHAAAIELMNARLVPLMQVFARDLGRTKSSFVARIKAALVQLGLIQHETVRAPDLPVASSDRQPIAAALEAAGLAARSAKR